MRSFFIITALLCSSVAVEAQISINFGFNIDRQPVWGPAGYDHVEYYYLPDIEVYYSVPQQRFYYVEGGVWVGRSSLPYRYRHYDFYHSYKVVINERHPYRNHIIYRDKYVSFKGHRDQQSIRDSRDSRYFINKQHPEHNNWKKQQPRKEGNNRTRERRETRDKK